MTLRNRWWFLLCILLLMAGSAGLAATGGFFVDRVLNRPDRKYFGGSTPYQVYIISNIPEREVMRAICREVLLRTHGDKNHCIYLPLTNVGNFGRQKKDLLPFDPRKDAETIVAIDRSTLTPAEKARLETLIAKHFPLLPDIAKRPQVTVWIQNSGKSGAEYQVLLDVPSIIWLEDTADELWALPAGTLGDKSFGKHQIRHPVNTVAICSNDLTVRDALAKAVRFSEIHLFGLAEAQQFIELEGFTQRILALNWNGDVQCPPALAARLLPPGLSEKASDLTPDATGLTGWQQFCRQAIARHDTITDVDIWTLCAPTARHLQSLAAQVIAHQFSGDPFTLPLCDLTQVRRLALGVYYTPSDYDEGRFTLQTDLDSLAQKLLPATVQTVVLPIGWSPESPSIREEPADVADTAIPTPNADAVLLLRVDKLSPLVKYGTMSRRLTPAYPRFTYFEPARPYPPDPDERRQITERGYEYPGKTTAERQQSRKYQADYAHWRDVQVPRWEKEHKEWEARVRELENEKDAERKLEVLRRKEPQKPDPPNPDKMTTVTRNIYRYPGGSTYERQRSFVYRREFIRWEHTDYAQYLHKFHDWEDRRERWFNDRDTYPVRYEYSITSTPQISLTGSLSVRDLRGEAQRPLWTTTLSQAQTGQGTVVRTVPLTMYGETTSPLRPWEVDDYVDTTSWRDIATRRESDTVYAMGQDLLRSALERGLTRLASEALWAGDVQTWNQPAGR
ncbi:MAG: hypothetical protein ACYC7E_16470 [Armatimonadota bacterium]